MKKTNAGFCFLKRIERNADVTETLETPDGDMGDLS